MTIEQICSLVDETFYKKNNYYLSLTNPEEFAEQVALKFGKQCFEVGRELTEGWESKMYDVKMYSTFEDYLKSLEYGIL